MTHQNDIRDFLRTGIFGPIRLGMTKTQVLCLLGKPQMWGGFLPWRTEHQNTHIKSYKKHPIWVYDNMEFHFGDNEQKLFLIWCDHLDWLKGKGDVFCLNRWVFKANPLKIEQVERELQEENINYTHQKLEYSGKLVTSGGVDIHYDYEDLAVCAIGRYDGSFIGAPDCLSQETT